MFLLAIFGAAAMLMAIVADVIDLRTTRPTPGIPTGPQTLDDLGSNLALAGFVGTAVMVIGGLLIGPLLPLFVIPAMLSFLPSRKARVQRFAEEG